MNRNHKVEKYLEIYKLIKKINNNVEFSSDFIVGYPGEENDDFDQTINLVKEIKFINSFSFIFSPRPGTCLLYTSPSPRDKRQTRMPSSA